VRDARTLFERPTIDRRALAGYRRERITELTVPVATALMEGGFVGVIADKVYHVHPAVLALITAAPMFGNLSSFVWARVARGRRKVPLVTSLQGAIVALVAIVAFAPLGDAGATLLVSSMVASRLLLAGMVTIRSTVWSLNYPREVRARLTGRLQVFTTLTIASASFLASRVLDADPESFRLLYGAAALVAVGGVVAFSRVPHLGETEQLELERGLRGRPRGTWAVLRTDRTFARYQACQFALGTSNMMIEAPLLYLVSRELGASYTVSIAMTMIIPMVLTTATIPLWALLIDRVHIAEFRARQSGLWVLSQALTWVGAMQGSLEWIAAGRVVQGVARGGGTLAWQLGHNDFSNQRDLASYMGAQVTLTGVRGAFAPFVGMLLYVGMRERVLPVLGIPLPEFAGIGAHTFGIACLLSAGSAVGFVLLARRIRV
jgi:hypothetical protein